MGRPFAGPLSAAGGVLALVVGLAAIDSRVRDQVVRLAGLRPATEIASVGGYVQDFVLVVVQAVRDQSMERAPLVIFTLAAMVLVLFMLRS
jgi:hypothetical protein